MKFACKLMKLAAAVAAVAGIAYLVVRYFDDIKAWLSRFCPCCDYTLEDDFEVEVPMTEPAHETPAPAAEEPAPAEQPAAAEEDKDPITAEEEDFEI